MELRLPSAQVENTTWISPMLYVYFRLTLGPFPFRISWPPSCSHWGSTRHVQAGNVTNHPVSGGVSEDLGGLKILYGWVPSCVLRLYRCNTETSNTAIMGWGSIAALSWGEEKQSFHSPMTDVTPEAVLSINVMLASSKVSLIEYKSVV